jgi:hypothetical protein
MSTEKDRDTQPDEPLEQLPPEAVTGEEEQQVTGGFVIYGSTRNLSNNLTNATNLTNLTNLTNPSNG